MDYLSKGLSAAKKAFLDSNSETANNLFTKADSAMRGLDATQQLDVYKHLVDSIRITCEGAENNIKSLGMQADSEEFFRQYESRLSELRTKYGLY